MQITFWSNAIIDSLLVHQGSMLVHCKTNRLLGQRDFDWDDFQYVVCELRGFVYKPRPRREATGFLAEMRQGHFKWHVEVALPLCWTATLTQDNCNGKRQRTK